jgi:hypothetical protein
MPETIDHNSTGARKPGRPRYVKTEHDQKIVTMFAQAGLPHDKIAFMVGIGLKTLKRYYRDDLKRGHIEQVTHALTKVREAANNGEPWAIKWILAVFAGMSEQTLVRQQVQQLGKDGNPIDPPAGNTYIIKEDERKLIEKKLDDEV